jgi:signal transduction histidine kinase/CheY-like chemotaxis protein/HPt (histidine-containing phosphotransfer) domain-containing protein/ribosomal protein L28
MVIASYFYVSDIERKNLQRNVKSAISYTEANIRADLLEPETMLAGTAETIRDTIIRGRGPDRVHDYLRFINNYVRTNSQKGMVGVFGFYGVFDVYSGQFITGIDDWSPPEDYIPASRPWYSEAVAAAGGVGMTEPYIDIFTNEISITFSRRIFDEDGNPLGIICLIMYLDRIRHRAINTQFSENGFGFLLDSNMEVIAHPEQSMLGTHLRNMKSGIANFEDELRRKGSVSERITTDYRGIESIVFIERLYNGWYMGIVTPKDEYYRSTTNMAIILAALGLTLAVIVTAILLRNIAEKRKADKRTKAMFNANLEKMREANDSKKTVNILKNILNSIDAMIYATVPHTGEILFINDYMKKIFNVKEDPIGKFCYKLFVGEEAEERCDFCPCHRLDKEPDSVVVWEAPNPIIKRILHNTDRYIEWHDGRIVHIQYSVDLTELIAAKEQAIQGSEAKSNFLAKMSHEIRTPMNAVLGITEIQLQNEALPPDIEKAFNYIYNSGYLLLNIINDILDLSKIEAGKLELTPINYDTASLINDTVHLNILRYDSKPIEFNLELDENIPSALFGDELRIKQILNNLLSNAFKYTASGEVSLSVSAEYAEGSENVTLVFRVSDTGQGMTPEQVDRLFDEYSRFNMETNRKTEGTGLGMNIAKHLVRMMNGDISVKSEPDKGSVFTVRLPQKITGSGILGREVVENLRQFREGRAAQMKNAPQIVREYMPYGRVLIVDDIETNLYVARGLLAPYGLSIETAISGFEAVEKIKNGASYDIIFMDHFMPGMDGVETTKIIRGQGYVHPIFALTANALSGQAEMFLENGFDGYISKPIDIRQLNAVINKLVRDKYPPEVIEAARKQKESLKNPAVDAAAQAPSGNLQLAEIFIRDAEKAITVLEAIHSNNYRRADDIQMYVINVHAMKSALANIGETELSDFALKLEKAGREQDIVIMSGETSAFLTALRSVIEKNKIQDDDEDDEIGLTDDGRLELRDKLSAIYSACVAYDKKTAKTVLTELRQKSWPRPVKELLNTISEHILHGDFEEAANAARDYDINSIQ